MQDTLRGSLKWNFTDFTDYQSTKMEKSKITTVLISHDKGLEVAIRPSEFQFYVCM